MTIAELDTIRQDAQAQQAEDTQALAAKTPNEISFTFSDNYASFVIESTKMAKLPKIEKFKVIERGVFGKKGEKCHGRFYVIVRVNGEWFDLPAFCEHFKCKCAGQNGFTDREKAKAFGEKALAKWGVESTNTSNGAADVLKSLGWEYDKKSKKWTKTEVEIRK
jgi:hypothetical protein